MNENSPLLRHKNASINDENDIIRPSASKSKSRIIDRVGNFHQSKGKMNIKKIIKQKDYFTFYYNDFFHSLIDAPTYLIISILFGVNITIVAIFALFYYWASLNYDCNLDISNFIEAFFFSIETMVKLCIMII